MFHVAADSECSMTVAAAAIGCVGQSAQLKK